MSDASPDAGKSAAGNEPWPGVAILIPALNCAETVAPVVAGARAHVAEVVVVDDGSHDATGSMAAAAGAQVVRHHERRGKGVALLTGMQYLAQRGYTHILTMDADGQHLPAEIPKLVEASRQHPSAIVIGDRRMDGVATKSINKFGNRFANRWVEIACGQVLPDTQSGFRVYPAMALALGAHAHHFAFETEILIRAARAGMAIRSVPVRVYYPPPDERVTHFRPVVDTIRIIFVVLGLIFRIR